MPENRSHEIDKIVGQNLRAIRKQLGYTQAQLAEELDVSFQQVQKYEAGHNRMSASMLWRISALFKCSVVSLFHKANDHIPNPASVDTLDALSVDILKQAASCSPKVRKKIPEIISLMSAKG